MLRLLGSVLAVGALLYLLFLFIVVNACHSFFLHHDGADHLPWYVRWELRGNAEAQAGMEVLGVSEWVHQMHIRLRH